MRRLSLLPRLACLVVLVSLIASCGPKRNEFAPPCPHPIFLKDLSDLIRYRPGSTGRDLTDVELRARLVALNGRCEAGSVEGMLDTQVQISIEMFRGPGMQGRMTDVPVFLAVLDGEEIINKQIFPVQFEFPANVDRATIATPPMVLVLPVAPGKSGASYTIVAGFQLTPEDRANNARRGF